MPAVSKGDGMRGLAVFISDIRNCKCPCHTQTPLVIFLRTAVLNSSYIRPKPNQTASVLRRDAFKPN